MAQSVKIARSKRDTKSDFVLLKKKYLYAKNIFFAFFTEVVRLLVTVLSDYVMELWSNFFFFGSRMLQIICSETKRNTAYRALLLTRII